MSEQTTPEPTMEEILASIRRIISEDDAPGAKAGAGRQADENWEPAEIDEPEPTAASFETEAEEKADEALRAGSHGEAQAHPAAGHAAEAAPEPITAHAPAPEPEPPAATISPAPLEDIAPMPIPAPAPGEPGLVGEDAATRAASAFDRLSAAAAAPAPPAPTAPSPAMPAAGRTLEDVTRELLQPLIKAWLDQNLPAIVQARVDEEVERIAHRRVR